MKTKYVIISPVRNEEEFVEKTIQSVISQSILPSEWIIVNDGSTDGTVAIISKYTCRFSWIKLVNLTDRGFYYAGIGVVEVFNKGIDSLMCEDWEYIVKLDCDIAFESEYFEKIFNKFFERNQLGIASGCTYLPKNGSYIKDKIQEDHPLGASKIYRRKCLEDIGGIKPIPGWDSADILAAQMKGWETRCFFEFPIVHPRQSGSRRNGITRGRFFMGGVQFKLGYSFIYTALKALSKILEHPYVLGSIGLITGYICAYLRNDKKFLDENTTNCLRKKNRKFLLSKITFWKS